MMPVISFQLRGGAQTRNVVTRERIDANIFWSHAQKFEETERVALVNMQQLPLCEILVITRKY